MCVFNAIVSLTVWEEIIPHVMLVKYPGVTQNIKTQE